MKTVIYYEADDGKRFENESKCIQYEFEKEFEPIAEMLMIWDYDGYKMPIEYRTDLDNAYTIYCSSITAAIFLKKWGEKENARTPYEAIDIDNGEEVPLGTFIWREHGWYKVEEVICSFEEMNQQMFNGEERICIPIGMD